jgi:peptide deformylase
MRNKYPERFARITTDEAYLRKPSKQVDIHNASEVELVRLLLSELEKILVIDWPKVIGYGLSICQLKRVADEGIESLRGSIVRIPGKHPLSLNMLNPQIIDLRSQFKYKGEGCLSFPGQYMSTQRYRGIHLGFIDANDLKPRELDLYGLEAVVLQHEVDHHDGILFMDRHQVPIVRGTRVGPNDPCPCGKQKDGKPVKAKKCGCGKYIT